MSELSPAKLELLKRAIDVQERMLDGCTEIFSGLRQSSDPEVVSVCGDAIAAINHSRDILEAMINRLDATTH
jgi:hypothetical protein